MRSVFAFILGIMVTVGAAYVHDNYAMSNPSEPAAKPMVNWDVVSDSMRLVASRARHQWDKLTSK